MRNDLEHQDLVLIRPGGAEARPIGAERESVDDASTRSAPDEFAVGGIPDHELPILVGGSEQGAVRTEREVRDAFVVRREGDADPLPGARVPDADTAASRWVLRREDP